MVVDRSTSLIKSARAKKEDPINYDEEEMKISHIRNYKNYTVRAMVNLASQKIKYFFHLAT